MKLRKFISRVISESVVGYQVADKEEFKDALLDLATLDMEDDQVGYPRFEGKNQNYLSGGKGYDLYVLNRESLPGSGPFEILIREDVGDEVIGFIRGNKGGDVISFNMIYIEDEYRGQGIGMDIYENLLKEGFIIKSDKEITDSTYSVYSKLVEHYGYTPLIFDDGRVGLRK